MSDPFDNLSFQEEINPQRWTEETCLHTPTFEALLKADGTLWLSGPALAEGFSVEAAQALTRFLSERVQLPPVEPVYDFKDFTPKRVAPMSKHVDELARLIADACYLLNLEADGELPRDEYEAWRQRWLREAGQALIEMGGYPNEQEQKREQAIATYQEAHPFQPDSDDSPTECPSCHRQTTKVGLVYLPGNEIRCTGCYTLPNALEQYRETYPESE